VETDLFHADIDLAGAVLTRAELLQYRVAPDWTAAGLPSLVTGKKQDRDANIVLLEVSPNRVYVAQSGLIGAADLPTHRTRSSSSTARRGWSPARTSWRSGSSPSPAACA